MKLNPCPFCGSKSVKLIINHPNTRQFRAFIKCNVCHARGPRFKNNDAEEKAIQSWNGNFVKDSSIKPDINQTTLLDQIK